MNKQNTNKINYNLNIKDVAFSKNFIVNRGSITQLIYSIIYSRDTYDNREKTNGLSMLLRNFFIPNYNNIISEYEKLFMINFYDNKDKYDVYKFNLHGYNGMLNRPIGITNIDFNCIYNNLSFPDKLKTLYQRIDFILKRQTPERYLNNKYELHYNELKEKLGKFLLFLKNIEFEYYKYMDNFRKTIENATKNAFNNNKK